jgi:hypothetical protein
VIDHRVGQPRRADGQAFGAHAFERLLAGRLLQHMAIDMHDGAPIGEAADDVLIPDLLE